MTSSLEHALWANLQHRSPHILYGQSSNNLGGNAVHMLGQHANQYSGQMGASGCGYGYIHGQHYSGNTYGNVFETLPYGQNSNTSGGKTHMQEQQAIIYNEPHYINLGAMDIGHMPGEDICNTRPGHAQLHGHRHMYHAFPNGQYSGRMSDTAYTPNGQLAHQFHGPMHNFGYEKSAGQHDNRNAYGNYTTMELPYKETNGNAIPARSITIPQNYTGPGNWGNGQANYLGELKNNGNEANYYQGTNTFSHAYPENQTCTGSYVADGMTVTRPTEIITNMCSSSTQGYASKGLWYPPIQHLNSNRTAPHSQLARKDVKLLFCQLKSFSQQPIHKDEVGEILSRGAQEATTQAADDIKGGDQTDSCSVDNHSSTVRQKQEDWPVENDNKGESTVVGCLTEANRTRNEHSPPMGGITSPGKAPFPAKSRPHKGRWILIKRWNGRAVQATSTNYDSWAVTHTGSKDNEYPQAKKDVQAYEVLEQKQLVVNPGKGTMKTQPTRRKNNKMAAAGTINATEVGNGRHAVMGHNSTTGTNDGGSANDIVSGNIAGVSPSKEGGDNRGNISGHKPATFDTYGGMPAVVYDKAIETKSGTRSANTFASMTAGLYDPHGATPTPAAVSDEEMLNRAIQESIRDQGTPIILDNSLNAKLTDIRISNIEDSCYILNGILTFAATSEGLALVSAESSKIDHPISTLRQIVNNGLIQPIRTVMAQDGQGTALHISATTIQDIRYACQQCGWTSVKGQQCIAEFLTFLSDTFGMAKHSIETIGKAPNRLADVSKEHIGILHLSYAPIGTQDDASSEPIHLTSLIQETLSPKEDVHNHITTIHLRKISDTLFIHAERINPGQAANPWRRCNQRIVFSESLPTKHLSPDSHDAEEGGPFKLKAVICHKGGQHANSGHFYTIMRTKVPGSHTEKWVKLDDLCHRSIEVVRDTDWLMNDSIQSEAHVWIYERDVQPDDAKSDILRSRDDSAQFFIQCISGKTKVIEIPAHSTIKELKLASSLLEDTPVSQFYMVYGSKN